MEMEVANVLRLAGEPAVLGPARRRRRGDGSFGEQAAVRGSFERGQGLQALPWDVACAHGRAPSGRRARLLRHHLLAGQEGELCC